MESILLNLQLFGNLSSLGSNSSGPVKNKLTFNLEKISMLDFATLEFIISPQIAMFNPSSLLNSL